MHVYEFEPRVLNNKIEVAAAVSGKKFTFPGTESRWTARLSPGISEFANIEDDAQLEEVSMEHSGIDIILRSSITFPCLTQANYYHTFRVGHCQLPRSIAVLRQGRFG
jgi:hypothetical protein